jgi:hypothetical protein
LKASTRIHNGDYSCEEERLSEMYDEPSICGRKLVVLRWNPDAYTPPAGQTKVKGKEKRMAIYLALHPPSALITLPVLQRGQPAQHGGCGGSVGDITHNHSQARQGMG